MHQFLVGYDIASPKRLARVHRAMVRFAAPIQYSIFLLEGSHAEMQRCLDIVGALINPKEDDVRCYPLPKRGFQCRLGRPVMPPGIIWTAFPAPLQSFA